MADHRCRFLLLRRPGRQPCSVAITLSRYMTLGVVVCDCKSVRDWELLRQSEVLVSSTRACVHDIDLTRSQHLSRSVCPWIELPASCMASMDGDLLLWNAVTTLLEVIMWCPKAKALNTSLFCHTHTLRNRFCIELQFLLKEYIPCK